MPGREYSVADALRCHGIPRRKFLKFCGSMATVLGLPLSAAAQVAATLEKKRRPVLVWLELQDCAGNSESMLRASHPSITELVLSFFSWEYHETIMAAAGKQAESALERVVREEAGKYLAVVEGSIPTADPAYCTIGGRSAMDIAKRVCGSAAAVIAMGSCAFDGGPQRSAPNPTGAIGVEEAIPGLNLVNTSARYSRTGTSSTTSARGAPITMPAVSWNGGTTMARGAGTAFTKWDAKGRKRTSTARWSGGTTGRVGPSNPATAARHAPLTASGTRRCRSIGACRGFQVSAWISRPGRSAAG